MHDKFLEKSTIAPKATGLPILPVLRNVGV